MRPAHDVVPGPNAAMWRPPAPRRSISHARTAGPSRDRYRGPCTPGIWPRRFLSFGSMTMRSRRRGCSPTGVAGVGRRRQASRRTPRAASRISPPRQARRFTARTATTRPGKVALAGGDGEAAGALRSAARGFAHAGAPLAACRARMDLARSLVGKDRGLAVTEARSALQAFDRMGATAEADRAAAFLRGLGVKGRTGPRDGSLLSRREREVLGLVCEGLSERRDRRAAVHQAPDRGPPREQHLDQARGTQPHRGSRLRAAATCPPPKPRPTGERAHRPARKPERKIGNMAHADRRLGRESLEPTTSSPRRTHRKLTEKGVVRRFYEIVGSGRPEDARRGLLTRPRRATPAPGPDLAELKASIGSFLGAVPRPDRRRPVPGAGGRPDQLLGQLHGHPRGRLRRCPGQRPAREVRRVGPVPGP